MRPATPRISVGNSRSDLVFAYPTTVNKWLNFPSWRHQNGDTLAFADGHSEYWKWRSAPQTLAVNSTTALQDVKRLQETVP
jgi:prepilin-type processing-associated H-X9-DG protein